MARRSSHQRAVMVETGSQMRLYRADGASPARGSIVTTEYESSAEVLALGDAYRSGKTHALVAVARVQSTAARR